MTQTYTPTAPATSATFRSLRRALVAVWAVFAAGAGAFVAVIGTNAPYADEWEFVPALLGEEPAVPWLWQQHNEHRLPLPRAVYLTLFALTHDFRAGMLLQVVMLAALALYLMQIADRLRGRPHWADAFFPVSLLHVGHWENFIMGYQICFVLFAVLATGLAVVALRTTRANAFRSGVTAGVLLMLLALTGGSGLVVVPPVAAWLVFVAAGVWHGTSCGAGVPPALDALADAGQRPAPQVGTRRGAKGRAALLLLLAALPLAYLGVYAGGYERPPLHPVPSTDPRAVLRVAGEVLAMSFGIAMTPVWLAAFAGILALGGATVALLVPRWKEPGERLSVAGLVAVTAGVAGVALAIGVGRSGMGGDMGLWSRYSMLSWPLLAAAYLVWVKLGRKWVPVALCVFAAFAFLGNTGTGMQNGAAVKSRYSAIEADAAIGLSAEQIVARQFPGSHQAGQEQRAVHAIPMLRAARVGIFAGK